MHSSEFYRMKRLYEEGRITEKGLDNAVARGVITAEEKEEITHPSDASISEEDATDTVDELIVKDDLIAHRK